MRNTTIFKLMVSALMIMAINSACKKDIESQANNTNNTSGPFVLTLAGNPVVFSVTGKVLDDNNQPVAGATVTGGGKTAISNASGLYRINSGNFKGTFATIRIEKSGYFSLVKTLTASSGNTQFLVSKLSPKTLAGSVASSGGSIQFGSGSVSVLFPANAFVDAAGIAVTGPVSVYATYIDPTRADALNRMPGNLSGVEAPSTTYLLQSFGMMGIELKNAAGEIVRLAAGKKASITATIPSSLSASAPASIPLWYFDDANGVWVKEGTATKVGNNYQGDVAHFTFWNMDIYSSFRYFEARFRNRNDSSMLAYGHFSINGVGSAAIYHETSDANGTTFGMIPSNTQLQLRFYSSGGTVVLDTLIGPYSNPSNNIGDVFVDLPLTAPVVKGVLVDCNGQAVSHGSMTAMVDSLDYHSNVDVNGKFSITLATGLSVNSLITITGMDSSTNTPVPAFNKIYTGSGVINTDFVFACVNGPAEFISYNLDGTEHLFVRNTDSAFCRRTYAFNRTEVSCRRANGSPMTEGIVSFVTGPTTVGGTDTSSILTLHQYSTASTPRSLNIVSFTENYTSYPPLQGIEGWVIGSYACVFRDEVNNIHNITANIRMWRRN